MQDPFSPDPALLAKLGSIIIHAEEFLSEGGHPFDKVAFQSGMNDKDVQNWLESMQAMAMIPVKRS